MDLTELFRVFLCYAYKELTWGCSIGTTKKGIGPAYSGKASRSGLRVHHLFDNGTFAAKFRKLVEGRYKRYGHFEYDTEGEILRYQVGSTCSMLSSQIDNSFPYLGIGGEIEAVRCRQRYLCPLRFANREANPGRGSQRVDVGYRFWDVPICHVVLDDHWGCLHGLGNPAQVDWGNDWCCQGVHHSGRRWAVPDRAIERK